jgi:hypothetical protein
LFHHKLNRGGLLVWWAAMFIQNSADNDYHFGPDALLYRLVDSYVALDLLGNFTGDDTELFVSKNLDRAVSRVSGNSRV